MNQFYTATKLPTILLDESILHSSDDSYRRIDTSIINPEIVHIFAERGLSIFSVEIFRTDNANRKWPIHIDTVTEWDAGKINWIYGNTECDMKWFKPKPNAPFEIHLSGIGYHRQYHEDDVEEIASFNIGHNAIVQTGIPHTAVNESTHSRFCVSVNITHSHLPDTPYTVPYSFAIQSLSDYLL